jgi:cytoskeletal protein CcmA (bactofilin family)
MFGKSNKSSPIDSLIGTGTIIEGNVQFTGGLRIDGQVKGNVKAAASSSKPGTLVVSELAKVEGEIDVAHVVINGTVAGPVTGNVSYKSIEIHGGAIVMGQMIYESPQKTEKVVELKTLSGNSD